VRPRPGFARVPLVTVLVTGSLAAGAEVAGAKTFTYRNLSTLGRGSGGGEAWNAAGTNVRFVKAETASATAL
jgi:hypothetical protein